MSEQQSRTWMSAADTAKLVRKALKADFPGIKFSVRSSNYAGGASIDVGWTDGPLTKDVDRTVSLYNGATFDGMQDLKSYHDSLLMTDAGPQVVHFGADFIMTHRDVSPERKRLYWRELERFLGRKLPKPVSRFDGGEKVDVSVMEHQEEWIGRLVNGSRFGYPEHATAIVHRIGLVRPWKGERCPGGDDEYCPGCNRYQGTHRGEHLR